jgi:hypothetical protein
MSQNPPAGPGDTLARVDAEIARLAAACDVIAANLVDLDADPAKASLSAGPLTGATQTAWTEASAALTELWDGYSALTAVLTKAKDLRVKRNLSASDVGALEEMVFGESIPLSTTTVPLAQRSLLAPGQTVTTCTPAQLLTAMDDAFTVARTPVARAGAIWTDLLTATATTSTSLDAVRAKAVVVNADLTTVDEAGRRLRDFMGALASDPLGCQRSDLDAIDAVIGRAEAELTSAVELAATLTSRLTQAHELAERVVHAQQAAGEAQATAEVKLTDAHVTRTGLDRSIVVDLAGLDALAAANQWVMLSPRLTAWTRRAGDHLAALEAARTRNTNALAERDELRGRLTAYQAKATRLGLGEHPQLSQLSTSARDQLYSAPCDLTAARITVESYQAAITEHTSSEAKNRGQR